MDYIRDEHRVHLIIYHLVWTMERPQAVLRGAIATDCRRLIEQKCTEQGWEMIELAREPDHIHLFVRVNPTVAASEVVKECKGVTSFRLGRQYAVLRRRDKPPPALVFRCHSGQRVERDGQAV